MFKVNGIKFNLSGDITIKALLAALEEDKRFSYIENFKGTVIINGKLIPLTELDRKLIMNGDEVKITPLIFGG